MLPDLRGARLNPNGSPPTSGATLERVLVLSASAGAGHVRAAQALERALVATGRVAEVHHIDILQYTSKLFRQVYTQAYLDLVNRCVGQELHLLVLPELPSSSPSPIGYSALHLVGLRRSLVSP
jgi:hypothetical protein